MDAITDGNGRKHFMPITHVYDPVLDSKTSFDPNIFKFLQGLDEGVGGPGCYSNSIVLYPSELSISWPSYLPCCRQSKHWKIAESMTKELLDTIYEDSRREAQDNGAMPPELQDTSSEVKMRKEVELMATSVKSAAYMYPSASPVRAGMLSQSMLLVFLHDGECHSHTFRSVGSTITDAIFTTYEPKTGTPQRRHEPLCGFLTAIIEEDPSLGRRLLSSIVTWLNHTKGYQSMSATVFESLRNYLDFRSDDIAREFIITQVMFACNIHLSETEIQVFNNLIRIHVTHLSLTNDLYSFERENKEHERTGGLIINAIEVIRHVYQVSLVTAKQLTRGFILDTERAFSGEFKKLISSGLLNNGQIRFAKALAECLAGQIFYSITSGRYGGDKAVRAISA
ncbi:isoprenoid synthase domain-containing protein [Aspergillus pseudotamarii]|uniref:Isoprenoid synthase domain-containing protein n=1 Tax=Aspergillus pseudotamarii TaxID=132259 RepID=A0A5N6SFN7_ASPPS|nr:isoprenoid synthase domain-containing protein [Aspergillus pseudotamarii]KAE8132747.1 isoprenoid synthase domain-containing protein [Aspergillus pseudotamarii]